MKLIAGVDIGNSTTEVSLGVVNEYGNLRFLSSSLTATTGIKGTLENVIGIRKALQKAVGQIGKNLEDISLIRMNEAAPVIGDTAMETITETIITESTMIGHNPSTPGGAGVGIGHMINITEFSEIKKEVPYIVIVPATIAYDEVAHILNNHMKYLDIRGAILQKDEAVLVYNRLNKKIPIIDEVRYIEKIPVGMLGAIEVAPVGKTIQTLSNPYGIASIFGLDATETSYVVPIAKSLVGNRSAVVIKTPKGAVKERVIPAGHLAITGEKETVQVDVDQGAFKIMENIDKLQPIQDIEGEEGSNVGTMINQIKTQMSDLTTKDISQVHIQDVLAVDTIIPVKVQGGLAGEARREKAVAIAAMVKTDHLPMKRIAEELQNQTGIYTKIAGIEAVMAAIGAMTTPGTRLPLAILDLGGGSTDAALLDEKGTVTSTHLAGAGELITMLMASELGLGSLEIAEQIKRYPLAKVETLFHIRMENGQIQFFDQPLSPKLFGKVVIVQDQEFIPIDTDHTMEKIILVRKEAKKKVFVNNAIRALKQIAPGEEIRNIPNVVLVGGSALDFEIPEMILEALSEYKIVAGRGNIRNAEGPRNAVATGLVMSYMEE